MSCRDVAGLLVPCLQNGDQFMALTVTKVDGGSALPEGDPMSVNGRPAVLSRNKPGEYRQSIPEIVGAVDQDGKPVEPPRPIVIKYDNANLVTWFVDGVRYEALSNLPVESLMEAVAALSTAK